MPDSNYRLYGNSRHKFDLADAARREMVHEGFEPDFPPGTDEQLAGLQNRPLPTGLKDLRELLWSSIDNDTSRDLDQIEFAERVPAGLRVLGGRGAVGSAG